MSFLSHVAIIMDGNGRWAKKQNKSRSFGHIAGVKVISEIISAANENKIKHLSLFAFSTENWNRPKEEIKTLIDLFFKNFSLKNIKKLNQNNIKMRWIGLTDNLNLKILQSINKVEKETKNNNGLNVNIFFNYSGISDIENAFILAKKDNFKHTSIKNYMLTKDLPPVDLLIRTSGEKRISNFMLYDIAYAEIIFEDTLWPDYNKTLFSNNLEEYNRRTRRFGGIDGK